MFYSCYPREDIRELERIQGKTAKMIKGKAYLSFKGRLKDEKGLTFLKAGRWK